MTSILNLDNYTNEPGLTKWADWAITASALIICFSSDRILNYLYGRSKYFMLMPVSGFNIVIGAVLAAALIVLTNLSNVEVASRYGLKPDQFIAMLLPPIIFAGCMTVRQLHFWRHFANVIVIAIGGTFISTIFVTPIILLGGKLGLYSELNIFECVAWAGLISATDPVACLAVFGAVGVGDRLFALVVGESLLNDAAAILIFDTAIEFIEDPEFTKRTVFLAIMEFLLASVVSILFGMILGVIVSLILKYLYFARYNHILLSLFFWVFGYMSFVFGQGIHISGIVVQVFCGLLMRHYTYYNLHEHAQKMAFELAEHLGLMAETLVYLQMGVELIADNKGWSWFIVVGILATYVGRAFSIGMVVPSMNLFLRLSGKNPETDERFVTPKEMLASWHVGLRGAVAIALAAKFPGHHRDLILTSTIMIVAWTVYVHGGTTSFVLEQLDLKKKPEVKAINHTPGGGHSHGSSGSQSGTATARQSGEHAHTDEHLTGLQIAKGLEALSMTQTEFQTLSFDNNYIRPFLTHYKSGGTGRKAVFGIPKTEAPTPGTITPSRVDDEHEVKAYVGGGSSDEEPEVPPPQPAQTKPKAKPEDFKNMGELTQSKLNLALRKLTDSQKTGQGDKS
eukprot:TRINITY_DN6037_c0_g1_i1.p1 TRINITY_DN6037_c0_g1~~TRINITY_DN6037_c0_g1_i1.p1  ORF type:complete len:623 (+),score=108.02 TRINITY_DN6037_c0_g1_i1:54-1922(+)